MYAKFFTGPWHGDKKRVTDPPPLEMWVPEGGVYKLDQDQSFVADTRHYYYHPTGGVRTCGLDQGPQSLQPYDDNNHG